MQRFPYCTCYASKACICPIFEWNIIKFYLNGQGSELYVKHLYTWLPSTYYKWPSSNVPRTTIHYPIPCSHGVLLFTTCGVIGIVEYRRIITLQLILFFTSFVIMLDFVSLVFKRLLILLQTDLCVRNGPSHSIF